MKKKKVEKEEEKGGAEEEEEEEEVEVWYIWGKIVGGRAKCRGGTTGASEERRDETSHSSSVLGSAQPPLRALAQSSRQILRSYRCRWNPRGAGLYCQRVYLSGENVCRSADIATKGPPLRI